MQRKVEIETQDLHRYATELRAALEAICRSAAFRTSPKSCAFLRHIVDNTLSGQVEVLKERLIGMSLLGRDASYDTGADAGVRVRANDVRKRLLACSEAEGTDHAFSVVLPPGAYVPRFFRHVSLSSETECPPEPPVSLRVREEPPPRLSLQHLCAPTVVALFLCIICIRWELGEEHPFSTFWQNVFQNHHAVLYLPSAKNQGGQDLIAMQQLKAALPLFNLAGQFHNQLTVVSTLAPAAFPGDVFLLLGTTPETSNPAEAVFQSENTTLVIEDTPAGRKIVDRTASDPRLPIFGRSALLTIVNGPRRSIRIEGTDDAAMVTAVEMLCERATFPEGLVDTLGKGAVTQIVFPLAPHAAPLVFYESLAIAQARTDRRTP
jgi:hypothetical protein